MSYHKVELHGPHADFVKRVDGSEIRHLVITTWWSKHDRDGHESTAYTSSNEDHQILRWVSNNNVVPNDIMDAVDWPHKAEMTAARSAEQDIAILNYIKAQANRSPEQLAEEDFERRAAFGPGVEVVDVITGERTQT